MCSLSRSRFVAILVATIVAPIFSIASVEGQSVASPPSRPEDLPSRAKGVQSLSSQALSVYGEANSLWLVPKEQSLESKQLNVPRLCAPIRSMGWQDYSERDLAFVPEPDHWVFSWKGAVEPGAMIRVVFDGDPLLPNQCSPAKPAGDGSVMLFAHQATTVGEKLRFEPQWYKNTVGYWVVPTDYATWELELGAAGDYSVAVLQGCGEGQGGSDAVITLRDGEATVAELDFQTVDTGHFQNFRWIHLGKVKLASPGAYQLRINAKSIAKGALFDVRAIHLVKQAK